MSRNTIFVRITVVGILLVTAAVLGQIRKWQSRPFYNVQVENVHDEGLRIKRTEAPTRSKSDSQPEVIVKFRPGVKLADIERIAAKNNDRVDDSYEYVKGWVSIDDLDGASMQSVADQYTAMTDYVEFAEPNNVIRLDEPADLPSFQDLVSRKGDDNLPNDPLFADQWALNNVGQDGGKKNADISALTAWEKTHGSEDVVVAVLDTGVDYAHTDLASNMWVRPDNVPQYTDEQLGTFNDLQGFDANANAGDPMDDNGHGTHCAGIIGAEGDNNEGIAGVNWHVQIMPLKFLGRGGFGTTKDAIEAINYAIDRKQKGVNLRIINASWGSTTYSKALEDAIRAAGENGILFVAAAGNATTNNDKTPHYPSNYPLPNVISVASLDRNDTLSSFSNFGANTVHIAAPGREIASTWLNDQYREASGTSMAAPYVSGVAALIVANDPDISVEKLRDRILKSVDKIDSLSGKVASGGRINAAKALGIDR